MRQGILKTAGPLSDGALETLKRRFEALCGDEIDLTIEEDPALIGGFVAYLDGKIYDMSVLSRLRGVGRQAREEIRASEERIAEAAGGKSLADYARTVGEHLHARIGEIPPGVTVSDYGTVRSCADGVVQVDGLGRSLYGELMEFENNAFGMALDLTQNGVGAVLFSGGDGVNAGSIVRGTGHVMDVGVGEEMLGRVVDPLGRPLDGRPLKPKKFRPLECPAPTIIDRAPVDSPLMTGILSIDGMIPIGKGQRELIIGDRQTGKTAIALSAVLNQSAQGVICVYCAVGQKASTVANLADLLTRRGVMDHCIIVASTASDSAAMQYITPYAGCSIAEEFMHAGRDVLIVYDDLSKHATSYRTMSLLLKRPPGRQAYPGDVFYLHSRLLERAAHLSSEKGGGSMTALPIVETMAGDISAYIPTNVISITDGQIFLESELFHSGFRPAVNVGLSVSRVGRAAQPPAMRAVSGTLRLQLAQYREMAVFSQFDSDIDASTKRMLDSGSRLSELLKQDQNMILKAADQVAVLLAFLDGGFDAVALKSVSAAREALCAALRKECAAAMETIDRTGELSDADRTAVTETARAFLKRYAESGAQ